MGIENPITTKIMDEENNLLVDPNDIYYGDIDDDIDNHQHAMKYSICPILAAVICLVIVIYYTTTEVIINSQYDSVYSGTIYDELATNTIANFATLLILIIFIVITTICIVNSDSKYIISSWKGLCIISVLSLIIGGLVFLFVSLFTNIGPVVVVISSYDLVPILSDISISYIIGFVILFVINIPIMCAYLIYRYCPHEDTSNVAVYEMMTQQCECYV